MRSLRAGKNRSLYPKVRIHPVGASCARPRIPGSNRAPCGRPQVAPTTQISAHPVGASCARPRNGRRPFPTFCAERYHMHIKPKPEPRAVRPNLERSGDEADKSPRPDGVDSRQRNPLRRGELPRTPVRQPPADPYVRKRWSFYASGRGRTYIPFPAAKPIISLVKNKEQVNLTCSLWLPLLGSNQRPHD